MTTEPPTDLPLAVVARDDTAPPATRRRPRALALVALLALVAAVGWQARRRAPAAASVAPVDSGTRPVFALARLEPWGEVLQVGGPAGSGDARLARARVEVGDRVRAGDLLVELDNAPRLAAQRETADRRLEQARARLAQVRVGVRASRDELEARLAASRATLALAERTHERRQQLLAQAAEPQERVDDALLSRRLAAAEVREVEARLSRYQAPTGEAPVDVLVAERDVAVAAAEARQAEVDQAQGEIRAPADGEILELHLHPGQRVNQGPVLDMGATHAMWARAEVYQADAPRVARGQRVVLEAAPLASPLVGHVRRIASVVQRQTTVDPLPAANTDARVVEVWIELEPASSARAARWVELQVRARFEPRP